MKKWLLGALALGLVDRGQGLVDQGLDQLEGDRGTDQSQPDGHPDQSQPADRFVLACEGVDAGAGCGAAGQPCCDTRIGCGAGLFCTAVNICDPQPCGDFLQPCCCRGSFRNSCLPDLLCQSGACRLPY